MQARSLEHRSNPQPGDYWHEMFSPYFIVLAVDSKYVLVCRKRVPVDKDHWVFDVQHTVTMTRERFEKILSYNAPGMEDKVPADVVFGHMSTVEEWRNTVSLTHEYET
jgi:hypothetical protein